MKTLEIKNIIADEVKESIKTKENILENLDSIILSAKLIIKCLKKGNKIILFGNGGSCADAQHIAGEFVGRFKKERRSFPAISLATDTSVLTCVGNDYGFEHIFSRQIEALAKKDDVVVAISTSGMSENVLQAVLSARKIGCKVIALTGKDGGNLKNHSDICIKVPSDNTARIQESHIMIAHIWCTLVDKYL